MMSSFWVIVACIGLALITLITRAFFMIPERELPLPNWLKRGLKYAPLAALAAVIAPEIVMSNGQLINSLADARLPALAASVVYFLQAQHSWHHCSGHGGLSASAYRSGLVAPRPEKTGAACSCFHMGCL
jgi:branched-subunit amino acid transport protein